MKHSAVSQIKKIHITSSLFERKKKKNSVNKFAINNSDYICNYIRLTFQKSKISKVQAGVSNY